MARIILTVLDVKQYLELSLGWNASPVAERFYNHDRPHGAHRGRTPYEALREKLQ